MALRFRTHQIEELPQTNSKQAPGFAWVTTTPTPSDPQAGAPSKKRARSNISGQSEQAREALSAKQQREIERRIRDLNSDNARAGEVSVPKASAGQGVGGGARPGKTTSTKKILASGKGFQHHVDDEEADIALRGRGAGGGSMAGSSGGSEAVGGAEKKEQRASKTPLARRKPPQVQPASGSPAPTATLARTSSVSQPANTIPVIDLEGDNEDDEGLVPFPSQTEMDALLNAPPLTYNEARSAPPPADAPPPRAFCEICSYWGRIRCLRCGAKTCGSVRCGEIHDVETCAYKPYA